MAIAMTLLIFQFITELDKKNRNNNNLSEKIKKNDKEYGISVIERANHSFH